MKLMISASPLHPSVFSMSVWLTALASFSPFSAGQTTETERIHDALQHMQEQRLDNWSFDAVERNNTKVYRMTYHAIQHGIGEIELLDIDDLPPTEKERESFAKDHPARKPDAEEKEGAELLDIVTPGSLRYKSTEEGISTYTFTPQLAFDGSPKSDYPLRGTLLFDETRRFIRSFQVSTESAFTPKTGMKVLDFDLHLTFSKNDNGTILPQSVRTQFRGKALFFITVQQDIEVRYFNYQQPDEVRSGAPVVSSR